MRSLNGEKLRYQYTHHIGTLSSPELKMTQSKKVQFQIRKQDVTIELLDGKHRGIYWTYPDTLLKAGPFKSEATAIEDAKLYSQYGTTSKHYLLEGNHRYPKPSTYTNRRAYNG